MAGMLALLVLLGQAINMRQVFINASPVLFQILIFQQEHFWAGVGLLLFAGVLTGLAAGLMRILPHRMRRVLMIGICSVAIVGLLQDLSHHLLRVGAAGRYHRPALPGNGLSVSGAVGLFIVAATLSAFGHSRARPCKPASRPCPLKAGEPESSAVLVGVLVLLGLPQVLGLFLSEVMTIVGLYVLLAWD